MSRPTRSAMTLIEVILALTLTTLVAGLIGGLMNWYVYYQTATQDRLHRLRTARGVLRMIAADLQGVYRESKLDMSALGPLMAGGGGSGGGSASGGGGSGSGGGSDLGGSSGATSGASFGASGGSAGSGMDSMTGDSSGATAAGSPDLVAGAALPPGIYAAASTIQVDLSRVPRPDQYIQVPVDISSGMLQDVPHDLKTVTYVVQMPGSMGVADPLGDLTGGSGGAGAVGGGLVRRSLSRSVMAQATENGQIDAINRTGDLISPHVVGLLLEFYDGVEWITTWDSSVQGLPLVVRVTVALQDQSTPAEQAVTPPLDLTTMAAADLQAMNVYLFQKLVPILGAARHNADLGSTSTEDPLMSGATDAI